MSKNRIKSLETEQKLKKSLLKFLSSTPLEKISIKEIAFDAKVNRGTFYLHYKDINELLRQIEEDVLSEIITLLKKWEGDSISHRDIIPAISNHIISQKELFKVLLINESSYFSKKIKDLMREGYLKVIEKNNLNIDSKLIEVSLSANYGILKEWATSSTKFDIREYQEFMFDQIDKIIQKYKSN